MVLNKFCLPRRISSQNFFFNLGQVKNTTMAAEAKRYEQYFSQEGRGGGSLGKFVDFAKGYNAVTYAGGKRPRLINPEVERAYWGLLSQGKRDVVGNLIECGKSSGARGCDLDPADLKAARESKASAAFLTANRKPRSTRRSQNECSPRSRANCDTLTKNVDGQELRACKWATNLKKCTTNTGMAKYVGGRSRASNVCSPRNAPKLTRAECLQYRDECTFGKSGCRKRPVALPRGASAITNLGLGGGPAGKPTVAELVEAQVAAAGEGEGKGEGEVKYDWPGEDMYDEYASPVAYGGQWGSPRGSSAGQWGSYGGYTSPRGSRSPRARRNVW